MADELGLKFSIDSADAVKGVEDVNAALGKTAPAAKDAETGVKSFDSAVGTLTGSLRDKLAPAGQAAYDAFAKLAAAETPRGLTRGILDAEVAMQKFKAAADAAKASGEKMPPGIAQALKAMQGDVDASSMKLGKLRDSMGDVKTRADAMGQGFAQASASGGSLNSMLSNLEARGGLASSFSKLALTTGGVIAAFKVGYETGKQFSDFMKTLGVNIEVTGKTWSNFASLLSRAAGDTAAGKWLRDLGDSTRDYGEFLAPLPGKMNEVMKAQQLLSREIQATDIALKALGVTWTSSTVAEALVIKQIALMSTRLDEAAKAGEDLDKVVKANAPALAEIAKGIEKWGISLDLLSTKMQTALLLEKGFEEGQKNAAKNAADRAKAAEDEAKAIERLQTEYERVRDLDIATVHDRNAKAMKEEAAAAALLVDALGRVADGLTAVSAQADNATAGLEGLDWEMRKATPATFELNDAQNALIEALAKISDAGGASSLWVGHLISQLETGQITMLQFTQKVNQLLQELTKMGPVMGNTAEELNAINSLLSKFKNTSGAGWGTAAP